MKRGTLAITGQDESDELLNTDALALLLGMLLDQQVPMEWAFRGPTTLRARLGHLDVHAIAAMDPEELVAVFCAKPALHRYPAAMGRRAHELCVQIVENYGGDPEKIWRRARSAEVVLDRLKRLPGYGEEKAQIFLAMLGKRFGVRPNGWQEAAGVFGDKVPRSVADVRDPKSLVKVRAFKQEMKAAERDKQGRPAPRAN